MFAQNPDKRSSGFWFFHILQADLRLVILLVGALEHGLSGVTMTALLAAF